MFNSFGNILKITTFGESHGVGIGGILDGFPSGILLDVDYIQQQLNRRKPAQSSLVTQRKESDIVQFLSGIFEGKTTGQSIGFFIPNLDAKSKDYNHNKDVFRPSHADFTYQKKYGIRDYRGGGRSSARETANWIVAGSIAKHIIPDIKINSYVSQVGNIHLKKEYQKLNLERIDINEVRCPEDDTAFEMEELIKKTKKQGNTVGGIITCVIQNVPIGLGEPIFHKLNAELAKAMFSINAVKGVEFGSGFNAATMFGSEHNDIFISGNKTQTNNSAGIQGGISNGMDIVFRIAFKPVATIVHSQQTIDNDGNITEISGKGRHDACVLPRAVPIVDALASFVLADFFLMQKMRNFH